MWRSPTSGRATAPGSPVAGSCSPPPRAAGRSAVGAAELETESVVSDKPAGSRRGDGGGADERSSPPLEPTAPGGAPASGGAAGAAHPGGAQPAFTSTVLGAGAGAPRAGRRGRPVAGSDVRAARAALTGHGAGNLVRGHAGGPAPSVAGTRGASQLRSTSTDERWRGRRRPRWIGAGDVLPHPAEIVRRATTPSTRLWERRSSDPDFLLLRIGTGSRRLAGTAAGEQRARGCGDARAAAAARRAGLRRPAARSARRGRRPGRGSWVGRQPGRPARRCCMAPPTSRSWPRLLRRPPAAGTGWAGCRTASTPAEVARLGGS